MNTWYLWWAVIGFAVGGMFALWVVWTAWTRSQRGTPIEPHRIEGTDIMLAPDPAHHGNHCA